MDTTAKQHSQAKKTKPVLKELAKNEIKQVSGGPGVNVRRRPG